MSSGQASAGAGGDLWLPSSTGRPMELDRSKSFFPAPGARARSCYASGLRRGGCPLPRLVPNAALRLWEKVVAHSRGRLEPWTAPEFHLYHLTPAPKCTVRQCRGTLKRGNGHRIPSCCWPEPKGRTGLSGTIRLGQGEGHSMTRGPVTAPRRQPREGACWLCRPKHHSRRL